MATRAACLISAGAAKSGNPCARFTAPYSIACRVISRITDSVKCETLSLRKCFVCVDTEEITSAIAGRLAQRFVILNGTFAPVDLDVLASGYTTANSTVEERRLQRRVKTTKNQP